MKDPNTGTMVRGGGWGAQAAQQAKDTFDRGGGIYDATGAVKRGATEGTAGLGANAGAKDALSFATNVAPYAFGEMFDRPAPESEQAVNLPKAMPGKGEVLDKK